MNIQDSYAVHGGFQREEYCSQTVGALEDVAFGDVDADLVEEAVAFGDVDADVVEEAVALDEGRHCVLDGVD